MNGNSDDRLMTVKEVAEFLGYHPRTVYLKAQAKELPHIRFGRTLRFSRRDLAAWVKGKTAAAV